MRLLLMNHEFPPMAGGASRAAAGLARECAALGHGVTVLTSRLRGQAAHEEVDGYRVERVRALRRKAENGDMTHFAAYAASAGARLTGLRGMQRPDAALAFFGIPAGVAAWWLKRVHGVPYVLALRGGDVPGQQPEELAAFHRLAAPVLRRVWRGAAAVVANSEALAATARSFAPELEISVVPNGVDTARFAPDDAMPRWDDDAPLELLFAGRLSPEKGLFELFDAVAALEFPWRLTLAGDGPLADALRDKARLLGIAERLRFAGFVTPDAMPALYRKAHALVHPSHWEGMPNAVLEAMASGLPCVVADAPASAALVRHGQTGLVVPRGDAEALTAALSRIAANPDDALAMGAAGRRLVEQEYGQRACAERYLALLRAAADR